MISVEITPWRPPKITKTALLHRRPSSCAGNYSAEFHGWTTGNSWILGVEIFVGLFFSGKNTRKHVFSMVPIDDGEEPCDISQLLQFWDILGRFWWLPQYSSSSKDGLGPRMDHPIFHWTTRQFALLPRFIVSPHRVPMWPEIKSQQLPWPNWNPNWNSIYCHTSRNLGFNCNMDAVFHCCPSSGAHHR